MTAETHVLRTEAEQALFAQFDAALANLPGAAEVAAHRQAAFDRFRATGLPHRRVEEWKYTDLRALVRTALRPAPRPSEETARSTLAASADHLAGFERFRLVLVDGHFFVELSDADALRAEGIEVTSMADLLADDAATVLDTPAIAAGDVVLDLNAAFVTDGVSIDIPAGLALSRPIEIVHLSTTAETAKVARNSIRVGAGASVRLIETHRGHAGIASQSNVATTVEVGDGAHVKAIRLQADGDQALNLSTLLARTGMESEFDHLTFTAGSAVSRGQIYMDVAGEGARIGLDGATMVAGGQHADLSLVITHSVPGSTSRVLYKNIADGAATGAFQGKIVVERAAQKTDGKMMNQSLHLSDEAFFASKPELEIYADDVQCGHGSTAGQIDETMLFYFLSRGIPRAEAEKLLITAFLAEAIEAVGDEAIADALEDVAAGWLSRRARLARAA